MKRTLRLAMAGALGLGLLAAAGTGFAAGYLKMGDIKGEATDSDHKDWIIIESMSSPMASSSSGLPTGKRQHKPFTITKAVDKASPILQEASTTGRVFPNVIIDYAEADYGGARATYLRYELENVKIVSYSVSGSSAAGDVPMETLSLNYEEIKMTPSAADENRKNNRKDKSYSGEKDKDR